MFGLVRLMFGFGLILCAFLLITTKKMTRKAMKIGVSICLTVLLITLSACIPFEDLIITFQSPEEAFEYYSSRNANVKLIVNGENSDFVVGEKDGTDIYLIIPKVTDGWKTGIGIHTKRILQKTCDDIIVDIYQYKNTQDFYITVFQMNGKPLQISNNYNAQFYCLENQDALTGLFYVYYAAIPDYNEQFQLDVNGTQVLP